MIPRQLHPALFCVVFCRSNPAHIDTNNKRSAFSLVIWLKNSMPDFRNRREALFKSCMPFASHIEQVLRIPQPLSCSLFQNLNRTALARL